MDLKVYVEDHFLTYSEGLLMVPGIWRELHGFSSNACLLVLASELFDEADYIREHTDFMRWVQAGRP